MIVIRRDIAERYLRQAGGAARKSYQAWLVIALAAQWRTPVDIRHSHPKASVLRRGRAVFNIKGNDYRLVAQINYLAGTVEIRFFGSHAEYDAIDAQTV